MGNKYIKFEFKKSPLTKVFAIFLFITAMYLVNAKLVKNETQIFKSREFNGIIQDIKYEEGNRGIPTFLLNNTWIDWGSNGRNIAKIAAVGDSVVKNPGVIKVIVYRKDKSGIWIQISH